MDNIQIYYIAVLVVSLLGHSAFIVSSKDTKELANNILKFILTVILVVPVAGRIFLWW